jgi:hypothetical protein
MARTLVVPFALPEPRSPRGSPLGVPQFVVLLAGVLLVPFINLWLIYPVGLDFLARDAVLAHRATFGFDVGEVTTDARHIAWGVTRVTPGGLAERAGFREGDVLPTHHGTPGHFLHGALHAAADEREACVAVSNMPARIAGLRLDRTVCLGSARTADPIAPTCPLPSARGICAAPSGGASLVWYPPVTENGRHALVLRRADGEPEVLVRAFERSVEVLWSPDGGAVAIADQDGGRRPTVTVHWGPLLTRHAELGGPIAPTVPFVDGRVLYPHRWEDASTLRVAVGESSWIAPIPLQHFRYRVGGSLTPVP